MAVDYDKFTPEERDTFVRNVLSEKEMSAAISAVTKGGRIEKTPEELLEFCFRVAAKKMEGLKKAIQAKRGGERGESSP